MKNIILFLVVCLIINSQEAIAAVNGQAILDDVENKFQTAASGWAATLSARASWLFWVLALISLVWSNGMLLLRKADLGEFYGEFTRFIVFTGFFWWLLTNGPTMAHDIIGSLQTLGGIASGTAGTSPSSIVDVGFKIFNTVVQQSSIASPVISSAGLIMGVIVIVVLALVAANMLILLVSGWILAYAGIFYLGFGGSRWTSDIAISYYKTVLNVGVQLMTMVLLVSIGQQFISNYYNQMDANQNLNDMASMIVAAVVLLVLVNKIPPMIGHIAQGGGTHAVGNGFGTGSAIAAVWLAGAAANLASNAVAAGSANIMGGAQAIMAAASKASQDPSRSADLVSRMGSGSSGSTSSASTVSPLAMAMGDSPSGYGSSSRHSTSANQGSHSGGTFSNLKDGIKQVVGEKLQARIDQTFPGQVASAIKQSSEAQTQTDTAASPQFDNNSLSGETTSSMDSMEDEIAAFRDGGGTRKT